MPINRLLDVSSFEPEAITRLNVAYEATLRRLYLVDRNDPIAETVARKIIEIGPSGFDDPAQISARAMRELGVPPQS